MTEPHYGISDIKDFNFAGGMNEFVVVLLGVQLLGTAVFKILLFLILIRMIFHLYSSRILSIF